MPPERTAAGSRNFLIMFSAFHVAEILTWPRSNFIARWLRSEAFELQCFQSGNFRSPSSVWHKWTALIWLQGSIKLFGYQSVIVSDKAGNCGVSDVTWRDVTWCDVRRIEVHSNLLPLAIRCHVQRWIAFPRCNTFRCFLGKKLVRHTYLLVQSSALFRMRYQHRSNGAPIKICCGNNRPTAAFSLLIQYAAIGGGRKWKRRSFNSAATRVDLDARSLKEQNTSLPFEMKRQLSHFNLAIWSLSRHAYLW